MTNAPGLHVATVTIEKRIITLDDGSIDTVCTVQACDPDGAGIGLVDALGMIEFGKDTLIRDAMGEAL